MSKSILDASLANLLLALIAFLIINTKAAKIAAFRFFIYMLIAVVYDFGFFVELDRQVVIILLFTSSLIDLSFAFIASRIKSPTMYIYSISFTASSICAAMVLSIDVFPEHIYNLINAGVPVAIMGALTYGRLARIS